ncbi:MAG: JDVT-CTERM system glutamic-type intramembrane protease [Chromatiales bacterium]
MSVFLIELGLVGRPRFHRDPLFWLAAAGGAIVALGIWLWIPVEGPPAGSTILWVVLTTVIIYPLLEELVFRGAVQGWLLDRRWGAQSRLGITVANLVTTAAFTTLHFLHHPPLWALSVAVPSLVFGLFRDRHGHVYPSIALHGLYNLFYLLAVAFG